MIIKEALQFIESEEMREFLQSPEASVSASLWLDLIAQSRERLVDKAVALREIAKRYPNITSTHHAPAVMSEQAFSALYETSKHFKSPPGSVFLLTQCWIDEDIVWNNDEFFGDLIKEYTIPFATFEKAHDYITEKDNDLCEIGEEISDDTCSWNEITRWDLSDDGKLVEAITWVLSNNGIIWGFDRANEKRAFRGNIFFPSDNGIRLPVPFRTGDIITIDMRPFVDIFHAVITWAKYADPDCCNPSCLYLNKRGYIQNVALKHMSLRSPNFSPLLRVAKYAGELPEWEAPLKIISERVKADSDLGDRLFDIHIKLDKENKDMTWANLKQFL